MTYDQLIGERGRSHDERKWFRSLERAIKNFCEEFDASVVHLAGGNARRVSPSHLTSVGCRVVIDGNQAPLRGAARLF